MARLNVHYVREKLKRIAGVSEGVEKRLREVLEAIEADPLQFEELQGAPALPAGVTARRAKVIHRKHDFRLCFLHIPGEQGGTAVLFDAFPRRDGYRLDWEWAIGLLEGGDEPNE